MKPITLTMKQLNQAVVDYIVANGMVDGYEGQAKIFYDVIKDPEPAVRVRIEPVDDRRAPRLVVIQGGATRK